MTNITRVFAPEKAFASGGMIRQTTFTGRTPNPYTSARNVFTYKTISTGIGKAIVSFQESLAGFGFLTGENGEEFYLFESTACNETENKSVLFEPSTRTFYHTCKSNGSDVWCYHMFQFIAAYDAVLNGSKSKFLDNYAVIRDMQKTNPSVKFDSSVEKEFFTAIDEIYCAAMESFDQAEILPIEELSVDLSDLELKDDMTHGLLLRDGTFTMLEVNLNTAAQEEEDTKDWRIPYNDNFTAEEQQILAALAVVTKDMTLNKSVRHLLPMIHQNIFKNILMVGSAGTGKTTAVRVLAHKLGLPLYIQNYSVGIEEGDILGQNIPNPDTDPNSKDFIWIDGQLTKCLRQGGIYLADEINFAKPGILSVFNNILDGVGQVTLPNGEVVKRHPQCIIVGAMNPGYEGTQPLNKALRNRFQEVIKFAEFNDAEKLRIVKRETGFADDATLEKMIQAQNKLMTFIKDPDNDIDTVTTIRNLVAWVQLYMVTKDVKISAETTIIHSAFLYEEDDVIESARRASIDALFN